MVRVALFLLIFLIDMSYAKEVCVINSYSIQPAKYVEGKVKEILNERGYKLVTSGCSVKILLGTPAVVKELKREDKCKKIYTFVLFPEKLGLDKMKNFFGIRIFPLPEKTYQRFLKIFCLKKQKVAVPVSENMLSIAKIYLPKKYFTVISFRNSPVEIFKKLLSYKVAYIFPDPKVLKIVNLTTLLNFCKDNDIKVFSGLSDLSKFGLDYTDEVDYGVLSEELVELIDKTPKVKILPCPCKE